MGEQLMIFYRVNGVKYELPVKASDHYADEASIVRESLHDTLMEHVQSQVDIENLEFVVSAVRRSHGKD